MSVALLGATVLVVVLYRGREVVALRTELDALRREVDSLKHRILEDDLLEQLKAFEDAVSTSGYVSLVIILILKL